MHTVLFVCVRNAGRSQMAEALFNARVDGRALARSAGSEPGAQVHREVIEAMAEVGIDLSGAKPKGVTANVLDGVTVVVGMGCGDECPHVPGALRLDWDVADPAGKPVQQVREIRDHLAEKIDYLIQELGLR